MPRLKPGEHVSLPDPGPDDPIYKEGWQVHLGGTVLVTDHNYEAELTDEERALLEEMIAYRAAVEKRKPSKQHHPTIHPRLRSCRSSCAPGTRLPLQNNPWAVRQSGCKAFTIPGIPGAGLGTSVVTATKAPALQPNLRPWGDWRRTG